MMREPITVDDWSVIRFSKKGESFFFVVTGVDENGAGICSNRIVALKGSDVPRVPYKDTGNIIRFREPRLSCRDDRGVTYKLLKKAGKGENPWPALVALLKWCGNRYRPGEFGHSAIFEVEGSLRAENIFGDEVDGGPRRIAVNAERPDREDGYPIKETEAVQDFMEIAPVGERKMGPGEVTCQCGWVSFALTRADAEREIACFNRYFDRLSTYDQEHLYGGRRSSLASYRCLQCGNADEQRFRRAKPEDCPDGVTLNPVVCERLARPQWD